MAVCAAACTTNVAPGPADEQPLTPEERAELAAGVRAHFEKRKIAPLAPPSIQGGAARRAALVELGQALAFDKILSDNKDISCMTCHPPSIGGDDDRTLSSGVGGFGLGPSRLGGPYIPRHAPSLFNLHAARALFWDGRLERLPDGSYRSPANDHLTPEMVAVFELGPLSALAMFPVTNRDEMRSHEIDGKEDHLCGIADDDFTAIWNALMNRLRAVPRYREMFAAAYPDWPGAPDEKIDTMTFAHASNAIAAYIATAFYAADTPWDEFVAGNDLAFLQVEELDVAWPEYVTERNILVGAEKFLDQCAGCHSGAALSDDRFHNTALAQLGPGLGDGPGANDDFGRGRVVGIAEPLCGTQMNPASCKYAFRSMPIRNALLTAPYGHAGQFGRYGNDPDFETDVINDLEDLRAFVAHYAVDLRDKLRAYKPEGIDPTLRTSMLANTEDIITHISPFFAKPAKTTEEDVDLITAFLIATTSTELVRAGLHSGTSTTAVRCGVIPASVPSGLSLDTQGYDPAKCLPAR